MLNDILRKALNLPPTPIQKALKKPTKRPGGFDFNTPDQAITKQASPDILRNMIFNNAKPVYGSEPTPLTNIPNQYSKEKIFEDGSSMFINKFPRPIRQVKGITPRNPYQRI
jgi:hypothetical protein